MNYTALIALVCACIIWGLSPLFYHQLNHIDPLMIMAYRVIWALFFLIVFLAVTGKLSGILYLVKNLRAFMLLAFASLMIGINQFGFIYSISVKQVIQASFAYYIFPLIAVFFGFIFLGEKFSKVQFIALFLALFGVVFLSRGLGEIPYIALLLGITFGIYGLIKNHLSLNSLQTISVEICLLSPIALGYLIFLGLSSEETLFDVSRIDFCMFIGSGLITSLPLFLFSLAISGLNYSTVGLVNYLNPTLQFFVAVVIFSETFTLTHGISFGLIWISLFLYSSDSIRVELSRSRKISSTD
ncbi:MAG: EamA family transporter RarD [Pseudomonadota bacterium]|nr:EamA family transporter RarD [Pseudomonadota bacterium]